MELSLIVRMVRVGSYAVVILALLSCGCRNTTTAAWPPADRKPAITLDAKSEALLKAIISDVLTNPKLQRVRETYGFLKVRVLALVTNSNYGVPWPRDFKPECQGYTFVMLVEGVDAGNLRCGGVRINTFEEGSIKITISNIGGLPDGTQVFGGCSVRYKPLYVDKKWTVELRRSEDF